MTPEQFADLIAEGDMEKIAEAVAPLNETQRRKLAKIAVRIGGELHTAWNLPHNVKPNAPALDAIRERLGDRYQANPAACDVAVLAVGSLSDAKKTVGSWSQASVDVCLKVLSDRRPEWIDAWVEDGLTDDYSGHDWNLIRTLIREGICRKPQSDAYVRWMATTFRFGADDVHPLSQILLEDPDTVEDVWRLFEVETEALSWPEDHPPPKGHETWSIALVKLSQEGHLDRQRLLDVSLNALSTGFKDQTLTDYMRFHNRLEPRIEETVSRQQTFVDLLSNPSPRVVTFALEKIGQIEQAGRLDGEIFLNAMLPVLHIRSKGQAKTALQIAGRLVKNQPGLLPSAVLGILEALSHPSADVQQQAIRFLETYAERLHVDHAATIRERLGDLSPSVRQRAETLASQIRPGLSNPTEESEDDHAFAARLAMLVQEAAALPSPWRERAGVHTALEAVHTERMPDALDLDIMQAHVLTGVTPIEPIQTVDELIDAVAHAVETVDSADEMERILDGISRLCDQRPSDFACRCAPLAKRIRDLKAAREKQLFATSDEVAHSLHQLFVMWLCKEPLGVFRTNAAYQLARGDIAFYGFFAGRMQEVIARIQSGRAQPLLAAPTHQGGWIDPIVFVQRVTTYVNSGDEPGPFDLIQALLRLAPDKREQALQEASDLPGHIGRAVRWALGGQDRPTVDDPSQVSLWLAAGRARCPREPLDAFPILEPCKDQPDRISPAHYLWCPKMQVGNSTGLRSSPSIEITTQPASPIGGCTATWPTVALHERDQRWGQSPAWSESEIAPWRIGVITQVWPLCLDPVLVDGIRVLALRMDASASTLAPNYVYLRPLFEPDRPWTELATLAVWLGLIGKDAGSKTTATDVLIQAIADGRARSEQMADVLARILPGGWVKLNRVADSMAEAARMSCAHTWFVADTLQHFLAGMEELPRDAHFVLSLLHELLTDLGMPLAPETRRRLETIQGTTKTAKAAAALRKLESQPQSVKLRQAGLEVLEARIARAKRWSGMPTPHSSTTPSRGMP